MTTARKASIQRSVNKGRDNINQNPCALAVAKKLKVDGVQRYLHTIGDLRKAAATRFSVRSVKSYAKSNTVGGARKNLEAIGARGYIVWVDGHVLLLNRVGKTIIDTAPRKSDRRKIQGIWGLYNPRGL